MSEKRIPEIRFIGFEDKWELRELGEFAEEVTRNDPTSTAPIMMITAQNGFINQSERYSFDNSGESLAKYTLLKKHELAYNHGASKLRPYGSCFALPCDEARIPFVYHCFSVSDNDPEFVSLYLNGSNVSNQLRKIVSSGARMDGLLNISYEDYSTMILKCPNIREQEQIANSLKTLDNLISLQQTKVERLIILKKSMLEKMFPKGDEKVPEIRFAGFSGEWEKRKLGEICERVKRKNSNLESKLPLTISAQYGLVDQTMFFKSQIASRDVSNYFLIKKGEFAYNKSYSDGYPFGAIKRLERYEMGVLSTLYIIFAPNNEIINSDYLASYYETNNWHRQVAERAAEGARNHGLLNISAEAFLDTELIYPSKIEEQKKIGLYFQELDSLIALNQHKLEKLKNIKSACLEKMFV